MGKGDTQRLRSRLRALRQQCDYEKHEAVKMGFQTAVMIAGEYLMKHQDWQEEKTKEFMRGLMVYASARLESRTISGEMENSNKELVPPEEGTE